MTLNLKSEDITEQIEKTVQRILNTPFDLDSTMECVRMHTRYLSQIIFHNDVDKEEALLHAKMIVNYLTEIIDNIEKYNDK